jgi:hypothetical protein
MSEIGLAIIFRSGVARVVCVRHCTVRGHEISDKLAKDGSVQRFVGPEPFLGRSLGRTFIHSFIHLAVCLTSGPKPLPKRALHIMRSRTSSFRCEYPLLSSRSTSSFLRLLPRIPVTSKVEHKEDKTLDG